MARKRYKAEEIVAKLRQVDVLTSRTRYARHRSSSRVWRRHYNRIRPHASLGYKPPAPEVFVPARAAWPATLRRTAPPATLVSKPTLN
jgi:transposase InsO family protein